MAISDAAVATFDTKYHYNLWRPETAIRGGPADDNPKTDADAAYAPFIVTPCFPSYPSAHATLSNAGREIIERLYSVGPYSITVSTPVVPGVTLQDTKLKQITADVDDARVYGGIHFRFDQEGGAEQGRRVGESVYKNNLRPKNGCSCDEDRGAGRGVCRNVYSCRLRSEPLAGGNAPMAQEYVISTIAGGPTPPPVPAVSVSIGLPLGVATDAHGNVYFSSLDCIFKVDERGTLTRVAGNSRPAYSGDGGAATNAQLHIVTTVLDESEIFAGGLANRPGGQLIHRGRIQWPRPQSFALRDHYDGCWWRRVRRLACDYSTSAKLKMPPAPAKTTYCRPPVI